LILLWHKKRSNDWRAGIMLGERETALAIVQQRAGQLPLLKHCGIHPSEEIRPALSNQRSEGFRPLWMK